MSSVVRPGTVWADNSPGSEGRTLYVSEVSVRYAHCLVLTNSTKVQRALAKQPWDSRYRRQDVRGKDRRILLGYFRSGPARSGYSPAPKWLADLAAEFDAGRFTYEEFCEAVGRKVDHA